MSGFIKKGFVKIEISFDEYPTISQSFSSHEVEVSGITNLSKLISFLIKKLGKEKLIQIIQECEAA